MLGYLAQHLLGGLEIDVEDDGDLPCDEQRGALVHLVLGAGEVGACVTFGAVHPDKAYELLGISRPERDLRVGGPHVLVAKPSWCLSIASLIQTGLELLLARNSEYRDELLVDRGMDGDFLGKHRLQDVVEGFGLIRETLRANLDDLADTFDPVYDEVSYVKQFGVPPLSGGSPPTES